MSDFFLYNQQAEGCGCMEVASRTRAKPLPSRAKAEKISSSCDLKPCQWARHWQVLVDGYDSALLGQDEVVVSLHKGFESLKALKWLLQGGVEAPLGVVPLLTGEFLRCQH